MKNDEQLNDDDWGRLRERLEQARTATVDGQGLSPERAHEIMEQRRRRLARAAAERRDGELYRVLHFAVAERQYAVDLASVHGVARCPSMIPLPDAPDYLRGLGLVRGEIFELLSLPPELGESPSNWEPPRVILLGGEDAEVGLLADRLDKVTKIRDEELRSAPADRDLTVVRGITAGSVTLLDVGQLLRRWGLE